MNNITDEMLLDYLDGTLSSIDRESLESQLHHPDLKRRLDLLIKSDALLGDFFSPQTPNPGFPEGVMKGIHQTAPSREKRVKLPLSIAIAIGFFVIGLGIYLGAGHYFALNINLPTLNSGVNYEKVTYGILITLLLSMMWFVDKVWLQPIFRNSPTKHA